MAEAPLRKRAVPAARPKPPATRAARPRRSASAPPAIEEEAPTRNYALNLTEELDAAEKSTTFEASLNKALHAITAAHGDAPDEMPRSATRSAAARWLDAVDKLPPIRLPIGPAIPWRVGLPALVAIMVITVFVSWPTARTDAPELQLPAQQTYPVQQQAPLFARPQPTDDPVADPATPPPSQQPIGVPDSGGLGFDVGDMAMKLVAVLALAYASIMILKRLGIGTGGAGLRGTEGGLQVQVVSSVALAPNRSVHVLRVPGGKTLLVGATPSAVNLLADLSESTIQ